jgi:hypothetical protein
MFAPKTIDEFNKILDDVIFEVDDIIASAEYEGDTITELTEMVPIFQQIGAHLRQLQNEIKAGTHEFGTDKNLPYMDLVVRWKLRLPFAFVLTLLNEAHRTGFEE